MQSSLVLKERLMGLVAPHKSLARLKEVREHPKEFFGRILASAIGFKAVDRLLGCVCPKRKLEFVRDQLAWKQLVKSRVARACQFVKVLMDDAYVFGYREFTKEEVEEQLSRWLILDWCGLAIYQVKTHLVWLSGHGRGIDAPVTGLIDLPGMLLTPHYRRWLLQRLRSQSTCTEYKEMMSETMLLGTKRGFPSVEDDLVQVAGQGYLSQMANAVPLQDTRKGRIDWASTTFTPDQLDIDTYNVLEGLDCRKLVERAIADTSEEVFGITSEVPHVPWTPSQRAGYEAPIDQGGILGSLIREYKDEIWTGELELQRMQYHNHQVWEVVSRRINTGRLYELTLSRWARGEMNTLLSRYEIDKLADCQVYFIREPLKLRTITAGTPSLYGGLGPILAHLREKLTRFRCFRLTKQECDWSVMRDRLNLAPLGPERLGHAVWDLFISGDYQQSTNDLSMEATSIAVDAAFFGEAWNIVDRALGAQRIHYNKEEIVQKRGQLMGSPLSFPFLCVINAAIARCAYQIVHPELIGCKLDELPFLINGDDFAARMSPLINEVWKELLSVVSWKLSPGKSYEMYNIVQINSQTRNVVRIVENDGRPSEGKTIYYHFSEPIPFLNGGYLHQMKKTVEQIDRSSVETMSLDWQSRWRSFERLPSEVCRRARLVMESNLESLLQDLFITGKTPFCLNLTNPVGQGGLGIPKPNVDIDQHRSWYGLHCANWKKDPLVTSLKKSKAQLKKERDQVKPLLMWKCSLPSEYNYEEHLAILVDDLRRDWQKSLEPLTGLGPGHLDAVVRKSSYDTMTSYSPSMESRFHWERL